MPIKKNNTKVNKIFFFTMGSLLIVIVAVFAFLTLNSSKRIGVDSYQVFAGSKIEYSSTTKLIYTDNGIAIKGDEDSVLSSGPLYQKDDANSIIVPADMVYCNPSTRKYYRIDALSTLVYKDDHIEIDGKKIMNGFLFDGENTYIFLEKVKVDLNGKEVEMAPFSTISVSTNNVYSGYDCGSQTIYFDQLLKDSINVTGRNFTLDVVSDVYYDTDKQPNLIFNRPDLLDSLK